MQDRGFSSRVSDFFLLHNSILIQKWFSLHCETDWEARQRWISNFCPKTSQIYNEFRFKCSALTVHRAKLRDFMYILMIWREDDYEGLKKKAVHFMDNFVCFPFFTQCTIEDDHKNIFIFNEQKIRRK